PQPDASARVGLSRTGTAGIQGARAAEKTRQAVGIVVPAAEHDDVVDAELEVRHRFEGEDLAAEPWVRPVAVAVELAEEDVVPELAEVLPKPGQQRRVDVLQPERRERGSIIAL